MTEKRRTRMTEDARRSQFKEAAQRLFERKRFENVTTKEIAEEAGLSRSLIYYYGASKTEILEELLRDLVRDHARVLEKMPSPVGSPADRVMVYLVKMIERDLKKHELRRLAVQHSWTWSEDSEKEFFDLIGSILDPISRSLEEVGIEWDLADRVAIWAIYTEGLRQVMNKFLGKLKGDSQEVRIAILAEFEQRVRPQISRLLMRN